MTSITGKKDAKLIKERYQKELDIFHERVWTKRDWLYGMNHKLKDAMSEIDRLQRDIEVDKEEREKLYKKLESLLKQETDFESDMWDKTIEKMQVKSLTIKQKFKDTDIDEVKYSAMQDYLKQYPQYSSKSSFSKILDKISEIESGRKKTKKSLHDAISRAKREISYFPRNIMEAKDQLETYKKMLKEGREKLSSMKYVKSIFYKLSTETSKLEVTIDTINHPINEYENTINKIEEEVNAAKEDIKSLGFDIPPQKNSEKDK